MRILVTGGAGYIGSHAVRLFLARGHDVRVYDNLALGHRQAVPSECLIVGDLADVHRLDHALMDLLTSDWQTLDDGAPQDAPLVTPEHAPTAPDTLR